MHEGTYARLDAKLRIIGSAFAKIQNPLFTRIEFENCVDMEAFNVDGMTLLDTKSRVSTACGSGVRFFTLRGHANLLVDGFEVSPGSIPSLNDTTVFQLENMAGIVRNVKISPPAVSGTFGPSFRVVHASGVTTGLVLDAIELLPGDTNPTIMVKDSNMGPVTLKNSTISINNGLGAPESVVFSNVGNGRIETVTIQGQPGAYRNRDWTGISLQSSRVDLETVQILFPYSDQGSWTGIRIASPRGDAKASQIAILQDKGPNASAYGVRLGSSQSPGHGTIQFDALELRLTGGTSFSGSSVGLLLYNDGQAKIRVTNSRIESSQAANVQSSSATFERVVALAQRTAVYCSSAHCSIINSYIESQTEHGVHIRGAKNSGLAHPASIESSHVVSRSYTNTGTGGAHSAVYNEDETVTISSSIIEASRAPLRNFTSSVSSSNSYYFSASGSPHGARTVADTDNPGVPDAEGDIWGGSMSCHAAGEDPWVIAADSLCVDAGSSSSQLTEDILGQPRPVGARIDIGAYERQ